jgi:hypothetical protein
VDAAGERRRTGLPQPLLESRGNVLGVVDALDLDPGVGKDALVVGTDNGGDRAMCLLGCDRNRICGGGASALPQLLRIN